MVKDQPDYTAVTTVSVVVTPEVTVQSPTVTWNQSASPLSVVLKDWNRGFEKGAFTEWTATDAEISTVSPYEGSYCCKLKVTGAKIVQNFTDLVPVTGIWIIRLRARSASGTKALTVTMTHSDETTNSNGVSIFENGWQTVIIPPTAMSRDKYLSGLTIESSSGEIYIDDVFLGLATDLVTGSVQVSQALPSNLQGEATARPKGGVKGKGSVTTTASYATVVEYTPLDDYKLELTKLLVSCPKDVMYQLRWNGTVISPEVYLTGGIPFTDWYPWGYQALEGDGVKKFDVQVKYPNGGAAATCHVEFVGELVLTTFAP
jgi:hypothetical protein